MGIQINGQTDIVTSTSVGGRVTIPTATFPSVSNINATGVSTFSGGIVVSSGTTAAPSISPSGDSNTGIFFPSADTVCIGEGGVEVLRVDSNGNLGIGTTNPTSKLHVVGSGSITSLGVGTTASGTTGEIRATNNVTAFYSSDINLKTNIRPIGDSLNKLLEISGVNFDWKDEYISQKGGEDGYFVRKNDVGVIAQEIEQVLPEAVATREDGYKAVRYELIIPLLIEAIKEQQKQIDELKNQVK